MTKMQTQVVALSAPLITTLFVEDRDNIAVSAKSVYGDNVWDYTVECGTPKLSAARLCFDWQLSDGTSLLAHASLLSAVKEFVWVMINYPVPSRPRITTILSVMRSSTRFVVRWMAQSHINSFDRITEADLDDLKEHAAGLLLSGVESNSASTLKTRLCCLSWLYHQRFKINNPLSLDPWADTSCEKWSQQRTGSDGIRHGKTLLMPDTAAVKLINCAISVVEDAGRLQHVRSEWKRHRAMPSMQRRVREFWVSQHDFSNAKELQSAEGLLRTAAYIVIAFFSGQRSCETLALRRGCFKSTSVDGLYEEVYYLHGYTSKTVPEAKMVRWAVPALVGAAIAALEGLPRVKSDSDNLFTGRSGRQDDYEQTSNEVLFGWLRSFVEKFDIRGDDGELWPLASHQLRKLYARFMIRSGLGLRQLQEHYKHVSIEMTRLYGDQDLYFELQQERFQLDREQVAELMGSQQPIGGAGADWVRDLRGQFLGKTAQEQDEFLSRLATSMHICSTGLGLCITNPSRPKPCPGGGFGGCVPSECPNSVVPMQVYRRLYEDSIKENEALLGKVKSQLQQSHISKQIEFRKAVLLQAEEG